MSAKPLVLAGPHGRVEIAADALETVVTHALADVEGAMLVRGRRAVELAAREGALDVELALVVTAGLVLPEVGERAQRAVAEAVGGLTGLQARVDVAIVGAAG